KERRPAALIRALIVGTLTHATFKKNHWKNCLETQRHSIPISKSTLAAGLISSLAGKTPVGKCLPGLTSAPL
ncbi:hypothetical protein ATANTOWER_021231, partial [Ataeniobius toweri]|nr:hypothetical protein [Ataeniobius toweri]